MADYFTSFSCVFDVGTAENATRAEAIRQQQADALDKAEGRDLGFDMQPDPDSGPGMLWISSDGFGEPEHVIAFALACAEAFDLSGRWGFAWALTCSKPRINSFGGGAQILDLGRRASMDWVDTEHWVAEQLGKGEAGAALAETILRPVAEAQGWNRHSQLSVLLGFIDGLIADDPEIADRLRAHVATASAADEDFTCRECGVEPRCSSPTPSTLS